MVIYFEQVVLNQLSFSGNMQLEAINVPATYLLPSI